MSDDSPDRLAVGRVAGAHGIRGGLRVKLYDPNSDALQKGRQVLLRGPEEDLGAEIIGVSPVPGKPMCRVTLRQVNDRNHAERLRGAELWIDRDELPELDEDEVYLADLIGREVTRRQETDLQSLGRVVGTMFNGAQDLLEVDYGGSDTWYLPVLPQFLEAIDDQKIIVDLPEGMLPDELEASEK